MTYNCEGLELILSTYDPFFIMPCRKSSTKNLELTIKTYIINYKTKRSAFITKEWGKNNLMVTDL